MTIIQKWRRLQSSKMALLRNLFRGMDVEVFCHFGEVVVALALLQNTEQTWKMNNDNLN